MKYTCLFTGSDNQSHFSEEIIDLTNPFSVDTLSFGEMTDVTKIDWHNPPRPQFVIMLEGSMEIEIGDGTRKTFHPGEILLAQDTTGQGHITRATSEGKRRYMVVTLPLSST